MKMNFDKLPIENNEIEYKLKLGKTENEILKWGKSIVAFANSNGGKLFVGLYDNKTIKGLTDKEIDETKNLVLKTINRHIFPHIDVTFKIVNNKNHRLLEIDVAKCKNIVYFKIGDYNETVFIRQDGASLPATIEQIISLSRTLTSIDQDLLNEKFIISNYSNYHALCKRFSKQDIKIDMLINKEIIRDDLTITFGLKMFADDFKSDDTLVICRKWNGLDKGQDEVLDKKEFNGGLSTITLKIFNFILSYIKTGFIKQPDGSRIDTYSYPLIAIREAIINALAHRDYSIFHTQIDIDIFDNRIEISSPGRWLPKNDISSYDINHIPSVRRNKIICNCFEVAGLMEKSGTGFKKIFDSYKNSNAKKPEYISQSNSFIVILYDKTFNNALGLSKNFGKYDKKIIEFCCNEPKTLKQIQDFIGYKSRSQFTMRVIKPLLAKGLIKKFNSDKTIKSILYISNKKIS